MIKLMSSNVLGSDSPQRSSLPSRNPDTCMAGPDPSDLRKSQPFFQALHPNNIHSIFPTLSKERVSP